MDHILLHRVGYLYGSVNADETVKVEVVYEPPQESTDTTFHVWEDPKEVSCQIKVHISFCNEQNVNMIAVSSCV